MIIEWVEKWFFLPYFALSFPNGKDGGFASSMYFHLRLAEFYLLFVPDLNNMRRSFLASFKTSFSWNLVNFDEATKIVNVMS